MKTELERIEALEKIVAKLNGEEWMADNFIYPNDRAELGQPYWLLALSGNEIWKSKEENHRLDNERYESGNYYLTKEEQIKQIAEKAINEIKALSEPEKTAIHCPTQELFDKVVAMKPNGKYGDGANWLEFKENTCLNISTEDGLALGYYDIKEFERLGYTIISAQDWIKSNETPTFEVGQEYEFSDDNIHWVKREFVKFQENQYQTQYWISGSKYPNVGWYKYARKIANVLPERYSIKVPKEWRKVFKKWADENGLNKNKLSFANTTNLSYYVTFDNIIINTNNWEYPEITIQQWSEATGINLENTEQGKKPTVDISENEDEAYPGLSEKMNKWVTANNVKVGDLCEVPTMTYGEGRGTAIWKIKEIKEYSIVFDNKGEKVSLRFSDALKIIHPNPEKICIHTPTQDLFDKVVAMKPNEKEFLQGTINVWYVYKENTCIAISYEKLGYAPLEVYKNQGYTIISAQDWIKSFEVGQEYEFSDDNIHWVKREFVKYENNQYHTQYWIGEDKIRRIGNWKYARKIKQPRTNIACKTSSLEEQIKIIDLLIEKGIKIAEVTLNCYKKEHSLKVLINNSIGLITRVGDTLGYTELSIKDFLAEFNIEWKGKTYAELQQEWVKEDDVKVGSRVKVVKLADKELENKFGIYWSSGLDFILDTILPVVEIKDNGIVVKPYASYPYFCLEVVKPLYQLPDENGVMVDVYEDTKVCFYHLTENRIICETGIFFNKPDAETYRSPLFATKKAVEKWIAENIKPKNRVEKGQLYWWVTGALEVAKDYDDYSNTDNIRHSIGNYYLTEASANKASDIAILTARYLNRLKELRGGDYVFNVGGYNYNHYCYNSVNKEIFTEYHLHCQNKSPKWYSDKKSHFEQLEKEFIQSELKLIITGE